MLSHQETSQVSGGIASLNFHTHAHVRAVQWERQHCTTGRNAQTPALYGRRAAGARGAAPTWPAAGALRLCWGGHDGPQAPLSGPSGPMHTYLGPHREVRRPGLEVRGQGGHLRGSVRGRKMQLPTSYHGKMSQRRRGLEERAGTYWGLGGGRCPSRQRDQQTQGPAGTENKQCGGGR